MSFTIQQEMCSCCHRCRVECPVQAITFRNDKYWIDPEKCIGCGHCASVCHNECISDPDAPREVPTPHEKITLNCDICVIGGGAAGLSAAAKAAEEGKNVIVLEKNKEAGGNAWYAHMMILHYSKLHEREGKPDNRQQVYEEFMEKTGYRINDELVRNLLQANSDFIDWLIEKHNLDQYFKLGPGPFGASGIVSNYEEEYNKKRIDCTIGPGGHGWWFVKKLLSIFLDNGGEILYHCTATDINLDADGAVKSVSAHDDGGEIEVFCKSAVVTAGTFTRNPELVKKMGCPMLHDNSDGKDPVHIFCVPHDTGDGITMCERLGADIDYERNRIVMLGPKRHPYPALSLNATSIGSLMVNAVGEPYTMDLSHIVSPLAYEPGRYCWAILDSVQVKENAKLAAHPSQQVVVNMDLGKFIEKHDEVLIEEELAGSLVKANSIPELAEKLGFDVEKLSALVNEMNARGGAQEESKGDETVMGIFDSYVPMKIETPPFYAFKMKLFHEMSVGGILTDGKFRVCKNGVPIPGLYAAGDNTTELMLPGDISYGYIEMFLTAMTCAFDGGYIVAKESTAYVDTKCK